MVVMTQMRGSVQFSLGRFIKTGTKLHSQGQYLGRTNTQTQTFVDALLSYLHLLLFVVHIASKATTAAVAANDNSEGVTREGPSSGR